jgi:hypothetical protein
MKKIYVILPSIAFFIPSLIAWLGGFNFDRGSGLVWCFIASLFLSILTYVFIGLVDMENYK